MPCDHCGRTDARWITPATRARIHCTHEFLCPICLELAVDELEEEDLEAPRVHRLAAEGGGVMSLSSGKASGKTCWCFSLAPTQFDGGAGQTGHERQLHERIAELEAELAGLYNDGWRTGAWVADLKARAEKAEAELAEEKKFHAEAQKSADWAYAAAKKAEAELALVRDQARIDCEQYEAEVERLRHLGGVPPGVSPSPPCSHGWDRRDDCEQCKESLRQQRIRLGQRLKGIPPAARKERDDG